MNGRRNRTFASTFMIELIPNLPDRVVGILASDQVSANDYEKVLVPAV